MSLANSWIAMYQARHNLPLEAAREMALSGLNGALGTKCTRADLWRWENGATMRQDRRKYILTDCLAFILEQRQTIAALASPVTTNPKQLAATVEALL